MNEAARDGKDKIDAKIFSYIIPPSTRAPRTKQAKEQPIEWLSEQVQEHRLRHRNNRPEYGRIPVPTQGESIGSLEWPPQAHLRPRLLDGA
jgi:hypothetical protein